MTRPHKHAVLAGGLRWLYATEQPDQAILSHHGISIHARDGRTYQFVPEGAECAPVVVVKVTEPEWDGPDPLPLRNPLAPGELEALAGLLAASGYPVRDTWNGHPAATGSVGLRRTAHPLLLAAVGRYREGCPHHAGPLCSWHGCHWYRDGSDLVIRPRITRRPQLVTRDPASGMRCNPPRWPHGTVPPPSGCRRCGRPHLGHGALEHLWEQPTDAQILARMRARRTARFRLREFEALLATSSLASPHVRSLAAQTSPLRKEVQ